MRITYKSSYYKQHWTHPLTAVKMTIDVKLEQDFYILTLFNNLVSYWWFQIVTEAGLNVWYCWRESYIVQRVAIQTARLLEICSIDWGQLWQEGDHPGEISVCLPNWACFIMTWVLISRFCCKVWHGKGRKRWMPATIIIVTDRVWKEFWQEDQL